MKKITDTDILDIWLSWLWNRAQTTRRRFLSPKSRQTPASGACAGRIPVENTGMLDLSAGCGDIETLMETIRTFDYAVVYQTIGMLEDSYDIEGMEAAAGKHNALIRKIVEAVSEDSFVRILHLGAGGCHICPVCARVDNHPCRFPHLAISSLEAYGINVSRLAAACGMKYINGQNTVTYFGGIFCSLM